MRQSGLVNDTTHGRALSGYYWPATAPVLDNKRALLVLHVCAQTAGAT